MLGSQQVGSADPDGDSETKNKCLAAGFNALITKPLNIDEVAKFYK